MFLYSNARINHLSLSLASSPAEFSTGKKNLRLHTCQHGGCIRIIKMKRNNTANDKCSKHLNDLLWLATILKGYLIHIYRGVIERVLLIPGRKISQNVLLQFADSKFTACENKAKLLEDSTKRRQTVGQELQVLDNLLAIRLPVYL